MIKKAQASFELLLILGFSLTLTILAGGYYMSYSNNASDALVGTQIERVFTDVMGKSTRVFFAGNGNRITIEASFPDRIEEIAIERGVTSVGSDLGVGVNFSYINVTSIRGGEFVSQTFTPDEISIQLNCTFSCTYDGERAIFDMEHLTKGPKRIRVESRGDYVEINFIN
ncbi:MAG: hypothetical protein LAT82_04060 [Nanoarchaeota archaeon]|nr:hypothetical protein [Nanoarchaeota archaeon]